LGREGVGGWLCGCVVGLIRKGEGKGEKEEKKDVLVCSFFFVCFVDVLLPLCVLKGKNRPLWIDP
jgi:hypothetical protein